jgi:hypothetical protein
MWIYWKYSAKRTIDIFILDKTVLNKKYQEHASLFWILNQSKYAKSDGKLYLPERDYYGFFPKGQGSFVISDIEHKTVNDLVNLAHKYDMVYYTDMYGIYSVEWHDEYFKDKPNALPDKVGERSKLIYGGLTHKELEFLKLMKQQKKLIINEFNIIASPTSSTIRKEFEKEFDIKWSGWVGRYFNVLDTSVNKELPLWLVRNYKQQNSNRWPFKKSGIAFVRDDDKVVILENKTHLENEVPCIYTSSNYVKYYNVAAEIEYPFWFDICTAGSSHKIVSEYRIKVNSKGDSILKQWKIPTVFPATIQNNQGYPYFYFAGDFADNPISIRTARFKHIAIFDFLFYQTDINKRSNFFWFYYRPLVTQIINDYYQTLSK